MAQKALGLRSEEGQEEDRLRFYRFEHILSAVKVKEEYRRKLDELTASRDEIAVERLVVEANVAFVLSMRVFEELDVM